MSHIRFPGSLSYRVIQRERMFFEQLVLGVGWSDCGGVGPVTTILFVDVTAEMKMVPNEP